MSKDNSEPAFPAPEASMEHYGKADGYTGMTLRDYFAAKAMQGICAHVDTWGLSSNTMIATASYELADAMLAARSA